MSTRKPKLRRIKQRQALLRVDGPEHSWASILSEAGLKYAATITQLNTGYISDEKLGMIEDVISRRESIAVESQ